MSQDRLPRRPTTTDGTLNVLGVSERESKARAPNAIRPVPGRRTGSSIVALATSARH